MSGIGSDPIGEAPAGVGSVDQVEPYQSPGYCRAVDPGTGDYVQASDGSIAQTYPTRQRVLLALSTQLGSAVDTGFGYSSPPTFDDRWERSVTARVRAALAHLTDGANPAARVTAIRVEQVSQVRARLWVSFVDLLADDVQREEDTVSYG